MLSSLNPISSKSGEKNTFKSKAICVLSSKMFTECGEVMQHNSKHVPIPASLKDVAGIKFKMTIYLKTVTLQIKKLYIFVFCQSNMCKC